MSLSHFYVLSPRGDTIISKDWRSDTPKNAPEIFFTNVNVWKGKQGKKAPPIFNIDGINYIYCKRNGLYFLFVNNDNISPQIVGELLDRLTKLFKDYCGILNEETVRANFVLIYELLDEIIDYGYIQETSTEMLKKFIINQPVVIKQKKNKKSLIPDLHPKTTPSNSVDKPIKIGNKGQKGQKNEIFVDIYEKINLTFNPNGHILNSSIDGTIQMKSYLNGNPALKLALNEDLVIANSDSGSKKSFNGSVTEIDDYNFHSCVNIDEFENTKIVSFTPPEGEFVVMNYRISGDFRAPFRIFPFFELETQYKIELMIKIRSDIPEQNYGANVTIQFPLPGVTSGVSFKKTNLVGQSCEYDQKKKMVYWTIKKFKGGSTQQLACKITLSKSSTISIRKELGPISMSFDIPLYNPSHLQVRYLKILQNKSYDPYRWVRYVTSSKSYVCRI